MAVTDMAGPWKSFSFIIMEITVPGIIWTHRRPPTWPGSAR